MIVNINKNFFKIILKSNKGQTLIEFFLLLIIIFTLSFVLLKGFNTGIGNRWVSIVKKITPYNDSKISLR